MRAVCAQPPGEHIGERARRIGWADSRADREICKVICKLYFYKIVYI